VGAYIIPDVIAKSVTGQPVNAAGVTLPGGVPVPLNYLLPAPEPEFIIRDSGARWIVAARRAGDIQGAAQPPGTAVPHDIGQSAKIRLSRRE
jgi:hypothetical protein